MKFFFNRIVAAGLLAALLLGCEQRHAAFAEKVKGADSVAINYFTGNGRMDSVVSVKIVKAKDQVAQLSEFIAGSSTTETFKCGYDGSLHYFSRGMVLQDVYFRMNDVQCMHFSFLLNGSNQATVLSPEARQWLEMQRNKQAVLKE